VLLILLFIVNIAVYCYLLRKPLEDHLICFTIIDALSIGSAWGQLDARSVSESASGSKGSKQTWQGFGW